MSIKLQTVRWTVTGLRYKSHFRAIPSDWWGPPNRTSKAKTIPPTSNRWRKVFWGRKAIIKYPGTVLFRIPSRNSCKNRIIYFRFWRRSRNERIWICTIILHPVTTVPSRPIPLNFLPCPYPSKALQCKLAPVLWLPWSTDLSEWTSRISVSHKGRQQH